MPVYSRKLAFNISYLYLFSRLGYLLLFLIVGAITFALPYGPEVSEIRQLLFLAMLWVLWWEVIRYLLFHTYTIEVYSDGIFLLLGVGLLKKEISMTNITTAEPVESAFFGFLLRLLFWRFGAGNEDDPFAVELVLANGRTVRIPTDDPVGLSAAIRAQLPPT